MPGLNAAFIDVGYKKDAFLHYLDLGPNFNTQQKFLKQALGEQKGDKKIPTISKMQLLPEIEKDGSISNVLKVGQEVLVQIAKEPISTKGPRLTSELSFAGRYIVLIPFADKVSVSTKIQIERRACPSTPTHPKYQAEELQRNRTHIFGREARCRTRS